MNRTVFIEGILIMVFSLVSMAEGLRLILHKDPYILYDPLGPGFYVLALSIGLMTVGIVHFIVHYRKFPGIEKVAVSRGMRIQLFSSIVVLALYIFLIGFAGYFVGTLVFYFLELRIAGVKSWRTNFILTLILTVVYYVIFVKVCKMVFPRGILF